MEALGSRAGEISVCPEVHAERLGAGLGVDHETTDAWAFKNVRPRVDANTERRGPYYWLKATQHRHFYV